MRHWRTIARRVVYSQPPWLEVAVEDVELPGGEVLRDFVALRSRDFSIAAVFTEDGRIPMIRSYKHGVKRVSLSLPAGYIEAGEEPLDCAKRELLEETGYVADAWEHVADLTIDGNYGLSVEHAFVARRARKRQEPASGDHEDMEVVLVGRDEAARALLSGGVAQVSSAAALSLALLRPPPDGGVASIDHR